MLPSSPPLPAPTPSPSWRCGVQVLVIRSDKFRSLSNQPQVRAAINRMQGASFVQAAMERFAECEAEVEVADRLRDALMAGDMKSG